MKEISNEKDQESAKKAGELLCDLIETNPEIEPRIWVSVLMGLLATSFKNSGIPYGVYVKEMKDSARFYKKFWEEK